MNIDSMNKKILEAFGSVTPDIEDEVLEDCGKIRYRDPSSVYAAPVTKKRFHVYAAAVSAALVFIVIGTLMICNSVNKQDEDDEPPVLNTLSSIGESPRLGASPHHSDIDLSGKTVVYGEEYLGQADYDGFVPGEVRMIGTLSDEIKKEENRDSVFFVEIDILFIAPEKTKKLFDELNSMLADAKNDPVYLRFIAKMNDWFDNVKFPSLTEEELAWYYDADEDRTIYYDEFLERYSETSSSEEAEEFRTALDRYYEAVFARNWYEVPQEISDELTAELGRLTALGLILDLNWFDARNRSVRGYLTADQIEDFPKNENYAYMIFFADEFWYEFEISKK